MSTTSVYAVVLHWKAGGESVSSVKQPLFRDMERALKELDEYRSLIVRPGYFWSVEELELEESRFAPPSGWRSFSG